MERRKPAGPHMTNADRHDTNQPSDAFPDSGRQSDDIPQRPSPPAGPAGNCLRRLTRCCVAGTARLDQPPEGECILTLELDRQTFGADAPFTFE